MIEDSTVILIELMACIPMIVGLLWAFITRPKNYYYKFTGGRLYKIYDRSGSRKEK